MNTTTKTNLQVLAHNEKFELTNVWTGYRKPYTTATIHLEQGKTKDLHGQSRTVVKKADSKNENKSQYSYKWLFIYNDNIYVFARGAYSDDKTIVYIPSVSNAVKAHNVELTEEEKQAITEELMQNESIKSVLTEKTKQHEAVNNYFEARQNKVNEIKEELKQLTTEELTQHLLNADNYKVIKVSKQETWHSEKYLQIKYTCTFKGLTLTSHYFKVPLTEDIKRMTEKKQIELANSNKHLLVNYLAKSTVNLRTDSLGCININFNKSNFTNCI